MFTRIITDYDLLSPTNKLKIWMKHNFLEKILFIKIDLKKKKMSE